MNVPINYKGSENLKIILVFWILIRALSQPSFLSNISLKTSSNLIVTFLTVSIRFNSAHQLLSQRFARNWCRFEIRTLEDTFQNYYCYYWKVHLSYCPDCFGILDIVRFDKADWVSIQYSKNYATRPMLTNEQIVTGEYRIGRMDDRMGTCDMERCSLMPFCVLFSTSCDGFGT